MIVKNESAMLARCLESVKGLDAIFIADTGSTDNTVEIAKQYTPNVCTDFEWVDDFAAARNHILSKVTTDYVLSIDADEILESVEAVREAVDIMEEKQLLAALVGMLAGSTGQEFLFPRLFKKSPEVWWEGAVHNFISVAGYQIGNVKITYFSSPAHQLDPDRAMRILKKEVDRTANAREMFYLGREYWYRGDFENAIKTFQAYVQKSAFMPEKADGFLFLARCLWLTGRSEEAREACMQAIIINANFKEAIMFMAEMAGEGSGNAKWEANAAQWRRMAATANNYDVLFVRQQLDL